MATPPTGYLQVGRIGRAHGVRGEVYVHLSTDRDERVAVDSVLWSERGEFRVVASRPANDRWLVLFAGLDDRSAAERLAGTELFALPVADSDALWVHDLIGSTVVEVDGTARGRCVAVIANPAHELLELESGALVPIPFVISSEGGRTVINPPAGLFDL